MRRHIIGLIGLAGLIYAAAVYLTQGYDEGLNNFYPSMSLRLGIAMSAIWLGFPDLDRLFAKYPPWLFVVALVLVGVIVTRPKFFPIAIGLVVIAIALQLVTRFFYMPKKQQHSKNKRSGN